MRSLLFGARLALSGGRGGLIRDPGARGASRRRPPAAAARGGEASRPRRHEPLDPLLLLLVLIIFVVLLMPVAMFTAAAVRFSGESRDRRLAAVRLVGADSRMARRIAAGEALVGAVLGLAMGGVFFLLGRQLVEHITLFGISVFASDLRPSSPLVLLIAFAVPVLAVAVTLLALRRVIVEPLGVVRRTGTRRRRLWWRLILPVVGLVLLYPLVGTVHVTGGPANEYQVTVGVVLLLIGLAALLPWAVEALVRRLGGGGLAWQLAIRRLQLDTATAARLVNGIAVAAAGTIALQMLFAGVAHEYTTRTGEDPSRAQVRVTLSGRRRSPMSRRLSRPLRGYGRCPPSPSTTRRTAHRYSSGTAPRWPSSRPWTAAPTGTCSSSKGREVHSGRCRRTPGR